MKLLVGLGNPGPHYHATRHNVGFLVIDALAAVYSIPLVGQLATTQYGEGTIGAHQVVLAKPLTFMNASGKAVADLCQHVSASASDLIVIHDDLDFPLGRVKVKTRGGDAGHYGVRSIIDHLGTGEFCRVRVGIGRPATKDEVVDFVLSPFTPVEIPLAEDAIGNAVAVVENLLR